MIAEGSIPAENTILRYRLDYEGSQTEQEHG